LQFQLTPNPAVDVARPTVLSEPVDTNGHDHPAPRIFTVGALAATNVCCPAPKGLFISPGEIAAIVET
jgi:hypothetical protein